MVHVNEKPDVFMVVWRGVPFHFYVLSKTNIFAFCLAHIPMGKGAASIEELIEALDQVKLPLPAGMPSSITFTCITNFR
jgi:hypothetical protein